MKKVLIAVLLTLTLLLTACSPFLAAGADADVPTTGNQAASSPSLISTNPDLPSAPPDGSAGSPPPGAGTGSSNLEDGLSTATGAYELKTGNATEADQTFTGTNEDQSGVYVTNGGELTLDQVSVTTSGNTSSDENSSFYGLNAGILAASAGKITMSGGTINTTGTGANGAFAAGEGSEVRLTDVNINATGDGGHGVMATLGGEMSLTNVDMTTSGAHAAPIATDRGGGTINSTGGMLTTTGQDSPCYYSTGVLNITGGICKAVGSEIAVIEGANSVVLTDTIAASDIAHKWGIMIYQSFSGDAQGTEGVFTASGGSLAYTPTDGPLFYVTNTNGYITLKDVEVNAASGILLKAEGNQRWGTSGSNGGTVLFTADGQTLNGDFIADNISSISLDLKNNSTFTGAINSDQTAKSITVTLDSSSVWNVAANSFISCMTNPAVSSGAVTNIIGNGYTVYYDEPDCTGLGGNTFTLSSGGTLTPAN